MQTNNRRCLASTIAICRLHNSFAFSPISSRSATAPKSDSTRAKTNFVVSARVHILADKNRAEKRVGERSKKKLQIAKQNKFNFDDDRSKIQTTFVTGFTLLSSSDPQKRTQLLPRNFWSPIAVAFSMYDLERNGVITRDEFKWLLAKMIGNTISVRRRFSYCVCCHFARAMLEHNDRPQ